MLNESASAWPRPAEKGFRPLPLLLAGLYLIAALFYPAVGHSAETGLRGTVWWGPVKPGPTWLGQSDEAPFSANFIVFAAGREVARFKSDKQGQFEISLPAGNYTIVPDQSTPVPAPQDQGKPVTVPPGGFAVVTLHFDTGLR